MSVLFTKNSVDIIKVTFPFAFKQISFIQLENEFKRETISYSFSSNKDYINLHLQKDTTQVLLLILTIDNNKSDMVLYPLTKQEKQTEESTETVIELENDFNNETFDAMGMGLVSLLKMNLGTQNLDESLSKSIQENSSQNLNETFENLQRKIENNNFFIINKKNAD
jgi:hypothetical protein